MEAADLASVLVPVALGRGAVMRLSVKRIGARRASRFDVDLRDVAGARCSLVEDLKVLLQEKSGVPAWAQRLFHEGRYLRNAARIDDLSLPSEGAVLLLAASAHWEATPGTDAQPVAAGSGGVSTSSAAFWLNGPSEARSAPSSGGDSDSLGRLSMTEIKQQLVDLDVPFGGVADKSELVELLRRARQEAASRGSSAATGSTAGASSAPTASSGSQRSEGAGSVASAAPVAGLFDFVEGDVSQPPADSSPATFVQQLGPTLAGALNQGVQLLRQQAEGRHDAGGSRRPGPGQGMPPPPPPPPGQPPPPGTPPPLDQPMQTPGAGAASPQASGARSPQAQMFRVAFAGRPPTAAAGTPAQQVMPAPIATVIPPQMVGMGAPPPQLAGLGAPLRVLGTGAAPPQTPGPAAVTLRGPGLEQLLQLGTPVLLPVSGMPQAGELPPAAAGLPAAMPVVALPGTPVAAMGLGGAVAPAGPGGIPAMMAIPAYTPIAVSARASPPPQPGAAGAQPDGRGA